MNYHKICTKCKVDKPFEDFNKNKNGRHGLASWCKPCTVELSNKMQRERRSTYRPAARPGNANKGIRGEGHPNARLTEDQVREMRRIRREDKLTVRSIAELFGINYQHCQKILEGRYWKGIE